MPATAKPRKRTCIVCGRDIPRRSTYVRVEASRGRQALDAYLSFHKVVADLRSRDDCRRHTNEPWILSHIRNEEGLIILFTTWDGETYSDPHFCTDRCAAQQGRASAHHGDRFTWQDAS